MPKIDYETLPLTPDRAVSRFSDRILSLAFGGQLIVAAAETENTATKDAIALFVGEHGSSLDPMFVAAGVKRLARDLPSYKSWRSNIHPVGKSELLLPGASTYFRALGMVAIDRENPDTNSYLDFMNRLFQHGQSVQVYPQGGLHRGEAGDIGTYKTGAARQVLEGLEATNASDKKFVIVPFGIDYSSKGKPRLFDPLLRTGLYFGAPFELEAPIGVIENRRNPKRTEVREWVECSKVIIAEEISAAHERAAELIR